MYPTKELFICMRRLLALSTVTIAVLIAVAPQTINQPEASDPRVPPQAEQAKPPQACGSSFAKTDTYRRAARRTFRIAYLSRAQGNTLRRVGRCLHPSDKDWARKRKHAWHRWRRDHALLIEWWRVPASTKSMLAAIASCESGGSPTAVSPSGAYRGKYQFDYGTWAGVGGTGDPAAAPELVQDVLAARLYARRGGQPWPNCP